MSDASRREALAEAAHRTVTLGLNRGTAGNVSVRSGDGFLITPSGLACNAVVPADLVHLSPAGPDAGAAPSSEWRMHRDIYQARPDAGAVVHTHPPFATALACLRRALPPVHYMIALVGGTVRCAPYAVFGSELLSSNTVQALDGRKACLLANHGMVAVGVGLEDALEVAVEVERLAALYWHAAALGEPVLLSEAEVAEALDRFRTYGTGPTPP